MEKEKKQNIQIILLSIVIVLLVGIMVYLLFFNKKDEMKPVDNQLVNTNDKTCDCPKCESNSKECDCSKIAYLGEKVTSVKEIKLTKTNQNVKVGNKTYKVKVDDSNKLYIDDYEAFGDIYADHLYLTDKFAFFTHIGQFNELINYALSEKGEVGISSNYCSMSNFKIVDGYLHATGGTEIGFEEWEEKDLLIKYIDNTLIVTYAK